MSASWGMLGAALAMLIPTGLAAGTLETDLAFPSQALGRDLAYALYLPDGGPGARFPVLYLLHGYGADRREWSDGIGIAAILDELIADGAIAPVIVVMPDGGKSWYVDSAARGGPGDYATAIGRDLVRHVDAHYPTVARRDGRAVAGLSMGGFGALHLAFVFGETFGAVAALSPAIYAPDGLSAARWSLGQTTAERAFWFQGAFGSPFDLEVYWQEQPFAALDDLGADAPRIFLASGDDDAFGFELGTVELFLELARRSIPAELRIDDGAHDWDYWRRIAPEMLRFFDAGWPTTR